jgi:hypothetical protein
MRKAVAGLLFLAVIGALGFWGLTSPAAYGLIRGNAQAMPAADRAPNVENGRTLFYAGGCTSCHATPNQDDKLRLGGGYALKSPFGTFHVPNISPHKQDGIGSWSTADFVRAMREGVSPDGRHYYPAFPVYSLSVQASRADTPCDTSTWVAERPAGRGLNPRSAPSLPLIFHS